MEIEKEFTVDINETLKAFAKKYALKADEMTQDQFAGVLRQMIASGDFKRYLTTDGRQAVFYTPFADVQRLKREIKELKTRIEELEK